jgi:hypothetical protein
MSGSSARTALFGGARAERLPDSAQRGASASQRGSSAIQSTLEEDNNALTAELERKVNALKHASIAIHDEVSDHNRMLNGMSADFDRTAGLMGTALARVEGLLRGAGGQGHMCYIVGFTLGIFLLLWWLMGKR